MRKGGIPDPDCPTDPESTRFWAHTHSKFTDREKVAVSHEAEVAVASTVDSITAMLSSTGEGAGQLALTNGSDSAASAPSGGPSLESLVGVIAQTATTATAKGKAKAKAKGKARAQAQLAVPKTPQEHRDAIRWLAFILIHSIFFCGG